MSKELSRYMLLEELRAMAICNELYLRGMKPEQEWDKTKSAHWFKRRVQAYKQIAQIIKEYPYPKEKEEK